MKPSTSISGAGKRGPLLPGEAQGLEGEIHVKGHIFVLVRDHVGISPLELIFKLGLEIHRFMNGPYKGHQPGPRARVSC